VDLPVLPSSISCNKKSQNSVAPSHSRDSSLENRRAGSEEEVSLNTYQAARKADNIGEDIVALLLEGVSTRGASRLSGDTVSKSVISVD
jgi:hypothetical protein